MSCDAKSLTQDFTVMSPHKHIKFPPLAPSQNQRLTFDHSDQNDHSSEGERDVGSDVTGVVIDPALAARKLCFLGSSHIYAGMDIKPRLLMYMETYLNKELHSISPQEPKYQELKLQVHRDIFGSFIKEFKTYEPILSAIKKEYENTLDPKVTFLLEESIKSCANQVVDSQTLMKGLIQQITGQAYQQDQIRELEPLRSHLRLVREECERKIQARWAEERTEIGALKREKQQLRRDIEAMRENEKATQAVVEHMQRELSNQYLQYREERDARRLLIGQLSDLTRANVKTETPADDNAEENKDPVELQLALKVCRVDLTRAQEELSRMKAEYWDVVPRRTWDTLEETHRQTLLQLHTLQADFHQVKSKYDTLLELHNNRGNVREETLDSTSVQLETSDEPTLPPALDQSEENAESNDFLQ